MKFSKIFAILTLIFSIFSSAQAAVVVKEDGTYKGLVETVNVTTGLDASVSGDTATVSANGSQAITGGTISGVTINNSSVGATTRSSGAFTTLAANAGFTNALSPSADSGATNKASTLTLTTPVDTTGTNTHEGVNLAVTVGNATGGTNTVNGYTFANYTGDAQVNVNAVNIGTSDGLGTANAIKIGTGWDAAMNIGSVSGFPALEQNATASKKLFLTNDTVASGQTSKTTSVTGITSAAKCVATASEVATNAVYIRASVAGSAQVVTTTSGDPGASNLDFALICFE